MIKGKYRDTTGISDAEIIEIITKSARELGVIET